LDELVVVKPAGGAYQLAANILVMPLESALAYCAYFNP